jgi:ADP-heptose:LPS heptosyltransferase
VNETFSIPDAKAYIAPADRGMEADIAVSLGVGENDEKRLPDPFEERLLRMLVETGRQVVIDEGLADNERERVRRLVHAIPSIESWRGAYAPFAATISRARLYVGYDSAGQHVAAACGVPLISIFAGYPSERMFSRWQPSGPGSISIIRANPPDAETVLTRVSSVLQNLTL